MERKPLKLDWHQLLPEKEEAAPPLDLEVVPNPQLARAFAAGPEICSSPMDQYVTDRELEEKLLRLKNLLDSGFGNNLYDKGQKLWASILVLEEERERRKLPRIQQYAGNGVFRGVENCKKTTVSRTAECSGEPESALVATSQCDSQSSFSFLFNKKLNKRAGSMSINKTCSSNPSQVPEDMNLCSISSPSARLCLREAPFAPSRKLALTGKRSANAICININASSFYSSHKRRRFSKRLKGFEGTYTLRSKKAQNVVLLDEEDVQSKDLTKHASCDRKEVKMYYPSRDDPQSVELSYSDMKCLEPEQYISSPIMNFYIRYLQKPPSLVNGGKCEYYFFNTYFYGKLEAAVSSLKCDRSLRFSKLRRWWKGVNIFEKSCIFLPIHKVLHWSLVIICIPPVEDPCCPVILHLDSLGVHNSTQIFKVIQCYLKEEWKHIKASSEKMLITKEEIKVPQQKNEYDCGLFVLYFMERFIEEAPQRLRKRGLGKFGRKWFRPEDASGLRKRLKELLVEEFESARLECGTEECAESLSGSSETTEEEPKVQPAAVLRV